MTNYSRSVLLLNGLHHSENLPVKFGFSPQIVPANIVKKLPSQRCPQPFLIAFFNFSHKWPTSAFTDESGHPRLSEKDCTQRLTRRNRSVSDGGGITTLGAFHTFWKPCVARCQNGKLCRFWVLAGCTLEERREPSEQRCAYARRCSEVSRPRRAA